MIKTQIQKIQCKKCGQKIEASFPTELNLENDNELKTSLFDDEFFMFSCPCCKSIYPNYQNLFVRNLNKGYIIQYFNDLNPTKKICETCLTWDEVSNQLACEENDERFTSSKMRIVSNINKLREKILLFESGIDDRIFELLLIKKQVYLEIGEFKLNKIDDGIILNNVDDASQILTISMEEYNEQLDELKSYDDLYNRTDDYLVNSDYAIQLFSGALDREPIHLDMLREKEDVCVVLDWDDGEFACTCDFYVPEESRISFIIDGEEYNGTLFANTKMSKKAIDDTYKTLYKINHVFMSQKEIDSVAAIGGNYDGDVLYHDCNMNKEVFEKYKNGAVVIQSQTHVLTKHGGPLTNYDTRFLILCDDNYSEQYLTLENEKYLVIDKKIVESKKYIVLAKIKDPLWLYVARSTMFEHINMFELINNSLCDDKTPQIKEYIFDCQFPIGYSKDEENIKETFTHMISIVREDN